LPWLASGAGALLALVGWLAFRPIEPGPLITPARPARSYMEAVARIQAIEAGLDPAAMHPKCGVRFLTHGQAQPRAIVLVHGYTDCPQQFAALGQQFYDLGYNVLIVPLPRHGLADRLNEAHGELTVPELAAYAGEMVDIAQGLGQHTTMMGHSLGANVTAWAAQTRADLDLAVPISPAFGFEQVPTAITRPAIHRTLLLPNTYEWWDPSQQAAIEPDHNYPRYFVHTLANILWLGQAVQTAAGREAPAAGRILVVTNANDHAVNNLLTAHVVSLWRRHGADVTTFEFPAELGLDHDVIEPYPPSDLTPMVYEKLIELVAH
jgi:carboxylesterase